MEWCMLYADCNTAYIIPFDNGIFKIFNLLDNLNLTWVDRRTKLWCFNNYMDYYTF